MRTLPFPSRTARTAECCSTVMPGVRNPTSSPPSSRSACGLMERDRSDRRRRHRSFRCPPTRRRCRSSTRSTVRRPGSGPTTPPMANSPVTLRASTSSKMASRARTACRSPFAISAMAIAAGALKASPTPRPLYRLPELLARPGAPILVTEGEKAADAAQRLFPDYAVTTPMHGAKSPAKTDWTPVQGSRSVTIWPDHDQPGSDFARLVAELADEAGGTTVSIVAVPAEFPEGWDLADQPPSDWTIERLRGLLEAAPAWKPEAEPCARPRHAAAAHDPGYERRHRRGDGGFAARVGRRDRPVRRRLCTIESSRAADTHPRSPGRRGNSPTDGGAHPARCGRRLAVSASGATR